MNISKDTLESMALILREYGYEVTFKESDTKMPYNSYKFNKISDLNLKSLNTDICLFLNETVIEDFKLHDYGAASQNVTIGYLDLSWDDTIIITNRNDLEGHYIRERLEKYDYVIKLSDVFKLMSSNKEFNT